MYQLVKRFVDFCLATTLILALSPFVLVLAGVNLGLFGRPIFFSQLRPGLHGKIFRMYKFRTMTNQRNSAGDLLPDEQRLTKWGRFLRSYSLDELPELWNVIRGDMSFVGPRPLLVEYLPIYSEVQRRRHDVRPGITGLAQVMGRNSLSWEEKFDFDIQYVDNLSLKSDLKILVQTVAVTLKREGISHSSSATMPPFTGAS